MFETRTERNQRACHEACRLPCLRPGAFCKVTKIALIETKGVRATPESIDSKHGQPATCSRGGHRRLCQPLQCRLCLARRAGSRSAVCESLQKFSRFFRADTLQDFDSPKCLDCGGRRWAAIQCCEEC